MPGGKDKTREREYSLRRFRFPLPPASRARGEAGSPILPDADRCSSLCPDRSLDPDLWSLMLFLCFRWLGEGSNDSDCDMFPEGQEVQWETRHGFTLHVALNGCNDIHIISPSNIIIGSCPLRDAEMSLKRRHTKCSIITTMTSAFPLCRRTSA